MGVAAYQKAISVAEPSRSTEHRLLAQVTAMFIDPGTQCLSGAALVDILYCNREILATFGTTGAEVGKQLPPELRGSIICLSLWVDHISSEIVAGRGELCDLIDINCLVMEGLSGGAG